MKKRIKITEKNFFHGTKATFKGCKVPQREPDYVSDSGSRYWYGSNQRGPYVIRLSNHWSHRKNFNTRRTCDCKYVASCVWNILTNNANTLVAGKSYFKFFKKI
jgi:hypothetical protein